jgi:hypothetical protein
MPDGTGLPRAFSVFYWNTRSGALEASESYGDVAVDVDGVFLPESRVIVRADADGMAVRSLRLSGHESIGEGP